MKIEILGAHNAESDRTRLPCLLIDDAIALDAGGLTSNLSIERQQKIHAVLLTHHHFDHTRDLVTLGFNNTHPPSSVEVYALRDTLEIVYRYLLDGRMYMDFTQCPPGEKPRLQLKPIAPLQRYNIGDKSVMPVAVNHSVPSVGYLITSSEGRSIFYTGDTSSGIATCWENIAPDVLFIEATGINSMEEAVKRVGHLTPLLLVEELKHFRRIKGYLPRVIAIHLPTLYEDEIRAELRAGGAELGIMIEMGYEGMVITL